MPFRAKQQDEENQRFHGKQLLSSAASNTSSTCNNLDANKEAYTRVDPLGKAPVTVQTLVPVTSLVAAMQHTIRSNCCDQPLACYA
jgi:hypothetical protein